MRKRTARSGFTLVEILVVVAIMGVLIGAGIGSYVSFDRKRKVEAAALEFATFLRATQKMADAGEKNTDCLAAGDLSGYYVEADVDQSIADRYAVCGDDTVESKDLYLKNKCEFKQYFKVKFKTIGRGVEGTDRVTEVTDEHTTISYQIAVDAGGSITIQRV